MTHHHDDRLAEVAAATQAQREKLRLRVAATRNRLLPARLKSDAQTATEKLVRDGAADAVAQVRAHPVASGAAVAALLAWAFRDPLLRHGPSSVRRLYDWLAGHVPLSQTPQQDASNTGDGQSVDDRADVDKQENLPDG
jgi:hypothetical protein